MKRFFRWYFGSLKKTYKGDLFIIFCIAIVVLILSFLSLLRDFLNGEGVFL